MTDHKPYKEDWRRENFIRMRCSNTHKKLWAPTGKSYMKGDYIGRTVTLSIEGWQSKGGGVKVATFSSELKLCVSIFTFFGVIRQFPLRFGYLMVSWSDKKVHNLLPMSFLHCINLKKFQMTYSWQDVVYGLAHFTRVLCHCSGRPLLWNPNG